MRSVDFSDGTHVEVPCLVLPSYMGNLLYTPPALRDETLRASTVIGQLELTDVIEKDFGSTPLSDLCAVSSASPRLIMSSRNMTRGVGVGTKLGLAIDAPGGRKTLTSKKLAERVLVDKPAAVIALADEVPLTSGQKRLGKSTERTSKMFKELMAVPEMRNHFIFGVAVSGHTVEHLPNMAKELLLNGARGIVIGGANLGETQEQLSIAVRRVRAAIGGDVPLMLQGVDSMRGLLQSVQDGVDFCSTNLPRLVTDKGHSLLIQLPVQQIISGSPDSKKPRTDETDTGSFAVIRGEQGPVLDLRDERYKADSLPLSPACKCHACRHHSRAYIHHLLKAKELLSEVLLYQHNQHQVLKLFEAARTAKEGDLAQWLDALCC